MEESGTPTCRHGGVEALAGDMVKRPTSLTAKHSPKGSTPGVSWMAAFVVLIILAAISLSASRPAFGEPNGPAWLTIANGDESPFQVTIPDIREVGRYRVSFRTASGLVPHVDRRATLQVSN